jgi:hypothetical protein
MIPTITPSRRRIFLDDFDSSAFFLMRKAFFPFPASFRFFLAERKKPEPAKPYPAFDPEPRRSQTHPEDPGESRGFQP